MVNLLDNSTLTLGEGTAHMGPQAPSFVPALQVLFHGDLSRIGDMTPKAIFQDEHWLPLGRLDPLFEARPSGVVKPLADPYISRGQAAIRWSAADNCFAIKASPSARLPTSLVELRRGESSPKRTALTGVTTLPPGSIISIGDRILLLLKHQPWYAPQEDTFGMVGETQEMWVLRQLIRDIASFEDSVLILGETGVGKELVAQALHNQSNRAGGPFMATNCAALPEHLIESLLFGHVKGAFTGATTDNTGLFVTARDGTLFLDEIGEMPLGLQAKLLRVLQEKVVVPVGGKRGVPINTKVIAATNRVPREEIDQGNLRSDLYYRLATHTITIPNLYTRFLDAPLLFVHTLTQTLQTQPSLSWMWTSPPLAQLPVPMDFFLGLLRHPWKGNIRELQNITQQTARLNLRPGVFASPADIEAPQPSAAQAVTPTAQPTPAPLANNEEWALRAAQKLGLKRKTAARILNQFPLPPSLNTLAPQALAEALPQHLTHSLRRLLQSCDFNQTHAAASLGVSRSTMISLMKRFGFPQAQDLTRAQLLSAHQTTGGDIRAMSHLLRISPSSLKARLKAENLT